MERADLTVWRGPKCGQKFISILHFSHEKVQQQTYIYAFSLPDVLVTWKQASLVSRTVTSLPGEMYLCVEIMVFGCNWKDWEMPWP